MRDTRCPQTVEQKVEQTLVVRNDGVLTSRIGKPIPDDLDPVQIAFNMVGADSMKLPWHVVFDSRYAFLESLYNAIVGIVDSSAALTDVDDETLDEAFPDIDTLIAGVDDVAARQEVEALPCVNRLKKTAPKQSDSGRWHLYDKDTHKSQTWYLHNGKVWKKGDGERIYSFEDGVNAVKKAIKEMGENATGHFFNHDRYVWFSTPAATGPGGST